MAGKARLGLAGRGWARLGGAGEAGQGSAWHGVARRARQGLARQGMARQARHGMAGQGAARHGGHGRAGTARSGRRGVAWRGAAWQARQAWLGVARRGVARRVRAGKQPSEARLRESQTKGTELRLDRWGSYISRVHSGGLGRPSQASFMRLLPSGDGDATYEAARLTEDVAEVDRAVQGCPRHIRAALWQQYAGTGTGEQKARALGISRNELNRRVRHGVDQVHHFLHPETAQTTATA